MDFIHIDWDEPSSREIAQQYGVLRRSTYVLLNPAGQVVWQWVGPLNQGEVFNLLEQTLNSQ